MKRTAFERCASDSGFMEKMPNTIEAINRAAQNAQLDFIRRSEARFDGVLDRVVERVLEERGREIVMLAGPSSSGKTTTAKKLAERFRALGIETHVLSLDDFYLNRDQIPGFSEGAPDYETVHALDLPLLQSTLGDLLAGREVLLPMFDFTVGKRSDTSRAVTLGECDAVIVEGLHALNPLVAAHLPKKNVLKLYISVSSRIYNENGNVVLDKQDLRFVRRMLRDYRFRASPVAHTFSLWKNVISGEQKYLFPFRAQADMRLNAVHLYAPCVFRDEAIGLLQSAALQADDRKYADRLTGALREFVPLSPALVPEHSLLREFLGDTGLEEKTRD